MCDYSLFQFPNRLARAGEEMITHRFSSGCIGFISISEDADSDAECKPSLVERNWPGLKGWFLPRSITHEKTAVCVVPGSYLRLASITAELCEQHGLSHFEEAVFIQKSTEEFNHRDALRFGNGLELSLQALTPGQTARVISIPEQCDAITAGVVLMNTGE